jgi:hypothetical protein
MSHLVFNSFPRSGNVFISNISGYAFSMEMSAVHMPEIFHVEGLYNVSIFRLPEDAISSLINKTREYSEISMNEGRGDAERISFMASQASEKYDKYLDLAKENIDKIQVISFSELIENYPSVIDKIAKRFSLKVNEGYESKIYMDKSSNIWSDRYDGHAPREKDETRVKIEEIVRSLKQVQMLNLKYEKLLSIV